ncbi:exosortase A [Novosphingobium sp. MW5]|nr:exosortase A [Novosphingobium sp. MW5]
MPPEARAPGLRATLVERIPAHWREPIAALALAWALLIACFARDWAAMFDQWWNISTYTHVLLVPPIIGWLVWQRWPELRDMEPTGWRPGLWLFAGAGIVWVLGAFSGFDLARQGAAVALLGASALTILGPKVGRALAFPLAYMVFLVPFGDELVPPLQLVTAKLTIFLTHASAIPAVIDGVFIDTPAGLFEVAEACSGVKFLIAMIAFGVLAANVCFVSWKRRIAFVALSIAAPILANGVRAWGTIYVAQFKGAEYATGFDHIVYGWFFFALVIALVIAIGWKFFDRPPGAPLIDHEAIEASRILSRWSANSVNLRRALMAMGLVVLAAASWAMAAERLTARLPVQVFLPEVPGWKRVDYVPQAWWEPRASGAEHRLLGRYIDSKGDTVDVFYALYSGQSDGREAGGFGEGALMPQSEWAWLSPGPDLAGAKADRLLARGQIERVAYTWYRTGGTLTGSNARLKAANTADRLLLRARPTAVLILSSEKTGTARPEVSVQRFQSAIGPVDVWMDRIGAVR